MHLALSFDEEIGCIGVRDALAVITARADLRPDVVVMGEPTMMRPPHSHMGKLAYEVVCRRGVGALQPVPHQAERDCGSRPAGQRAGSSCSNMHRPVAEPEVTFNCGTIGGGSALNVIAERCTFTFEIRHTADHDPATVLRPFDDCVDNERATLAGSGGSVDRHRDHAVPGPADCQPTIHGCSVVERIADAGPATSIGFGTEGGLFAEALDVSVVICGPGDIAVAHRPDEYVTVDQLLRCERFLCALVQQICVEPR